MGDETLSVDSDALAAAVPALVSLRELQAGHLNTLNNAIAELGDCWKGGATGEQFAANYLGPAQKLLAAAASLDSVTASTADGISTMAKGFGETEDGNVQAARGLAGGPRD